MKIIKHKGMTAMQNKDHCVKIFDSNGDLIMSCTFPRQISENELKSTVDNYFLITNKKECC